MYRVDAIEAKHRVIVHFEGFLSQKNLAGLDEALQNAVARAKGSSTSFDMLCDFSKCEVMGQDTVADSERRIAWCIAQGLRKSANVVSKALMTVQLKRVAPDPRFESFTDIAEAEAWLAKPS